METNEKGARKTGRSRYWSVMLVGDHGRVIPFRHFKALIVGVGVVLILSLCALILLGVLYTRQRAQIGNLRAQLEQLRIQSTKIRDEKDLYLTQLIALQKQTGALSQKPADASEIVAKGGPPQADTMAPPVSEEAAPQAEEVPKETPVQKAEPQVKWSADIRNFKVSYDNRQGGLTAEFRIYNTSRPKKRLLGRTVVVFKAIGDSPSQWAVVPDVPLKKDIPVGRQGRRFSIRNYQTERFKTLRRKNSPKYDIAAVYIFKDQDGELIGNKEQPFNVDYSPPAPPKPVVAPPKSVVAPPKSVVAPPRTEPEKSTSPPQVPQTESETLKPGMSDESTAPKPAPGKTEPPSTVTTPDSPSGSPAPNAPSGQEQPESQLDSDGNGTPESGAPDTVAPTSPAEQQPAQEGEVQ